MDVYGSVCVGRVGIFGRKGGITRRILGVLGRMRTGCVGLSLYFFYITLELVYISQLSLCIISHLSQYMILHWTLYVLSNWNMYIIPHLILYLL